MKRVLLIMSIMFYAGMSAVYADSPFEAGEKVKESFRNEFPGVTQVKWSNLGDYQKAVFVFNGSLVNAYFNQEGGLEGYARNVLYDQLPLAVVRSLEKHFPEADFTDVNEVTNPDGTSYWLTVEMYNKKYRIECTVNGDVIKKIINKRKGG